MYNLTVEKLGKYKIYCLSSKETGFSVKFVPEKGATISDLRLNQKQIYDGYTTFEDLDNLAWGRGILLAPFPNRLEKGKYSFEGIEYQFPINDLDTGSALHGFVSQLEFNVGELETNEENGSIICHTSYAGEYDYFPFPFTAKVQYILEDRMGFSLKFSVTNSGNSNMPIGLGWHPYFSLSEDVNKTTLQLPKVEMVEIDKNMIPTGKKTPFQLFEQANKVDDFVLDNCFKLNAEKPLASVIVKGEKGKLTYSQSTDTPFLQIFTPPHRKSIAIEPMTCNVDAFNNGEGLTILKPKETITLTCEVKLES